MKRIFSALTLSLLLIPSAVSMAQQGPPPPPPGRSWGGGGPWDPSWNNRPHPGRGACFFADPPFRGKMFCANSGEQLPLLPDNFGDIISSIQVFGGAHVRVFNDRYFRNGHLDLSGSIDDLRRIPFRGKNWNDRISSLIVD